MENCETCGHYTEDRRCKLGTRTCFPDRDWIPKDAPDLVNHPAHYEQSCSLECIQVMELVFGANAVREFMGELLNYLMEGSENHDD